MAKRTWTDEQRSAHSEKMKAAWKRHSTKRRIREARRLKRENGENLVNIEQMASDEAYRDYQREYKRIYYKRPEKYAAWKVYTHLQKLKKRSMAELIALRDKHVRNGHDEWRKIVEQAMRIKMDEFIENMKIEAEKVDAQIHSNT